MLAVAFVAATSLTMVACSEEEVAEPKRLATPDVDVIYRSESFDVMWKAVEGADYYRDFVEVRWFEVWFG